MTSRRSLLGTIGAILTTGCISESPNDDSDPLNQSSSPTTTPVMTKSQTASPDPGEFKGSTATDDSAEDIRLYNNTEQSIQMSITVTDQSRGETVLSRNVSLDPPDQWYQANVFNPNHDYVINVKQKDGAKESKEFTVGTRVVISVDESDIRIRSVTH